MHIVTFIQVYIMPPKKTKAPKETPEECTICYDTYTPIRRKKVVCKYCNNPTCCKCIETYLLGVIEDAHCPHCRVNYSDASLLEICTQTYLTQTYFRHRQEVLMNRERAMLPGLQDSAQEERMHRGIQEQVKLINADIKKLVSERIGLENQHDEKTKERYNYALEHGIRTYKDSKDENIIRFTQELDDLCKGSSALKKTINEKRNTIYILERDGNAHIHAEMELKGGGSDEGEKKKFIRRCTADSCTGFVNHVWHCGLCENYICNKCFAVKGKSQDTPHTCKQEDVDTAELIKQDSKPCPSCGEFISKSSGCDQMWCISCHTPFSWNTGKVIHGGTIHNPHFYEWQRRNNGGEAPRAPGDIPCGGIPYYYTLRDHIRPALNYNKNTPYDTIMEIHRICTEIQELVEERFRTHLDLTSTNNINIRYLLKDFDEKTWGLNLAKNEKKRKRDREIQDIFAAFNMAAVELFNRIIHHEGLSRQSREDINNVLAPIIEEFSNLIKLINEAFKKNSIEYKYIVPQIELYKGITYKNFFKEVKATKPKRAPSNPFKNMIIDPDDSESELSDSE